MLDLAEEEEEKDDDDDSKFQAWKRRAEAITELRQAQEDMRNEEARSWEDWLADASASANGSTQDWDNGNGLPPQPLDPNDMLPESERGLVRSVRNFLLGREDDDDDDDDLLYEDRVFRYASINSASISFTFIVLLDLILI